MAYAFTQDVPIDAAFYKRITDGLGDDPPKGLIVHLAVERPEGGLRYFDVWETEEDWDRFAEERLHPRRPPTAQRDLRRPSPARAGAHAAGGHPRVDSVTGLVRLHGAWLRTDGATVSRHQFRSAGGRR